MVELIADSQVFPAACRILLPLLLEIYRSTILLSDAQRPRASTRWVVNETGAEHKGMSFPAKFELRSPPDVFALFTSTIPLSTQAVFLKL